MAKTPKWRRFEALVARIQKELAPEASITRNERIRGRRSNQLREIDIAVRQSIGQYQLLVVIDCKDYQRPVDVRAVENFIGLLDDVAASQGAIVAARGFSESAKIRAEGASVNLYTLVDAEAHDWQSFVSIPTLADFREISKFALTFRSAGPGPFMLRPCDFNTMVLYRSSGETIDNVHNLIRQLWLADNIPMEPGTYDELALTEGDTFIKTDGQLYQSEIRASVIVVRNLYFGHHRVEEIRGFADVIRGGIITREFRTESVPIAEVERSWKKISTVDELVFEPMVRITARVGSDRIEVHDEEGKALLDFQPAGTSPRARLR